MKSLLSFIGNIIWFVFIGLISGLAWFLIGLLLCITIILIPFGLQCFKFAKVSFFPFGKQIDTNFGKHPIMNIIWLLIAGWELCCFYLFTGILLCITIIGIPAGLQIFKLAIVSLMPFGANIK